MYPKIFLSIDNCFASKRWTTPAEWSSVISSLGVNYIEASADTELDPLFMGEAYLQDWVRDVRRAQEDYGVRISSLYSGHGTYATLGLGHTDSRVRERMREKWFKPLIRIAGDLDCGMGFFAHAFSESVLQEPARYRKYNELLIEQLSELNAYAGEVDCRFFALEQMYSPHQIPWTIAGTREMLRQIYRRSGVPFYFTEDVGHHSMKFLKPDREQLAKAIRDKNKSLWLGSEKTYELFALGLEQGKASEELLDAIQHEIEQAPHFFAGKEDGDCYAWLKELGCYSPIIHLQQTDGHRSKHEAFISQNNTKGIIHPKKILKALKASYDKPEDNGMPPRRRETYLTLELFSGTTSTRKEILDNYSETVKYWRQYIPKDGLPLNELL